MSIAETDSVNQVMVSGEVAAHRRFDDRTKSHFLLIRQQHTRANGSAVRHFFSFTVPGEQGDRILDGIQEHDLVEITGHMTYSDDWKAAFTLDSVRKVQTLDKEVNCVTLDGVIVAREDGAILRNIQFARGGPCGLMTIRLSGETNAVEETHTVRLYGTDDIARVEGFEAGDAVCVDGHIVRLPYYPTKGKNKGRKKWHSQVVVDNIQRLSAEQPPAPEHAPVSEQTSVSDDAPAQADRSERPLFITRRGASSS